MLHIKLLVMKKFWVKLPLIIPMLVVIFIIVVALVGSLKNGNMMWKDARDKIYELSNEEGLFRKSSELFAELLKFQNHNIKNVNSIDDLNKKYPAFIFSLPYSEDSITFSLIEDIRCVGINEKYLDSLEDNNLKIFYYNSRLPQLFEAQKVEVGNKLLKLDIDKKLEVKSISLVPSMFKVPLEKIRWRSSIYGQESPLFPSDSTIFLSWGKAVLPIRIDAKDKMLNVKCKRENDSNYFTVAGVPEYIIKLPKNGYYEYYNDYKKSSPLLQYNTEKGYVKLRVMVKKRATGNVIFFEYNNPTPNNDLAVSVFTGDETIMLSDLQGASFLSDSIPFVEGMKIVLRDKNEKITEFVLTQQNPICLLSSEINTNQGFERYIISECYTDIFTQQLLRGLSSTLPYYEYNDDIKLSIDPILSHEMENEMRTYLKDLKKNFKDEDRKCGGADWDMSMTVIDIETGNILAAPCVSDRVDKLNGNLKYTQRNTALQRRSVGSAFKPLLALATVLTNKSLLDLDTRGSYRYIDSKTCEFLGTKVGTWAENNKRHWDGCNFKEFISRSDDVYPAALVALCMNGCSARDNLSGRKTLKSSNGLYPNGSIFKDNKGGELAIKSTENSNVKQLRDYEMFKILDMLYDLNDYGDYNRTDDNSRNTELYVWRNLNGSVRDSLSIDIITPDYTNMDYSMTLHKKDVTFRSYWVPWILGQGGNDWSCIKLAEAYSRMISKRKVRASLVVGQSENEPLDKMLSSVGRDMSYTTSAWNGFLEAFAAAQKGGGTLLEMYKVVEARDDNLVLFSKTGTPNQYAQVCSPTTDGRIQYMDVAYYCFGLMTKDSYNKVKVGKQPKGIVCVIRVSRKLVKKEKGDGLWSSHARNFFSGNPQRLKKFYEMTKIYY